MSKVITVNPCPIELCDAIVSWIMKYFDTLSADGFFENEEQLRVITNGVLTVCPTFGVLVDEKYVGMIWFETGTTPTNVSFHFVSSPEAFGKGYMDKAAKDVLKQVFDKCPTVNHISASFYSKNKPAKAFVRRLGFNQNGTLREFVTQKNIPLDVVSFELLRSQYGVLFQQSDNQRESIPAE